MEVVIGGDTVLTTPAAIGTAKLNHRGWVK